MTAWETRPRLIVYTRRSPFHDPLDVLALAPQTWRVYWHMPSLDPTYAGIGSAAVLTADGPSRFARLQLQIADLFADAVYVGERDPQAAPRLFGGFGFTPDAVVDPRWTHFPPALLVLPHYTYSTSSDGAWLTVCAVTTDDSDLVVPELRDQADAFIAALADLPGTAVTSPALPHSSMPHYLTGQAGWTQQVETITTAIHAGTLNKAVLAHAVDLPLDRPLDPAPVMRTLQGRYPATYCFLIQPAGGHAFFGASPELIAQVTDGRLYTAALAGSRRRGKTSEEDHRLHAELLASGKEREEHALVVAALRERLTPYTTRLSIADTPQVMRLQTIQHLYTPVTGDLQSRFGVLDLVAELHPTPALGGWPSHSARRLIAELEPTERGWYAAPVGWVGANGDGVFAVAIRSAISAESTVRLYAGAGIVGESDPAAEWQETLVKLRPLLDILMADAPAPAPHGDTTR